MKTVLLFLVLLISTSGVFAQTQGTVTFANSTSTLIQTNGVGLGGSVGVTATNVGGFYYAVFTAEPTVTTITLSDLLTTNWTFTGLYGSNRISQPGGRLNGGVNVTVPTGWPPWVTKSFVVLGWSGNIAGKDWPAVQAQLGGVEFTSGTWFGTNWQPGSYDGFIGLSAVGNGQSIWTDLPSPNLFGLGGYNNWNPVPGFELYAVAGPTPPQITQQPHSQVVPVGSNVVLRVETYGWEPHYQWQRNETDIPRATESFLNIFSKPGDAGSYRVIVSNAYGSVTSSNAELVVLLPPVLTATTAGGGTVTLDPPLGSFGTNAMVTVTATPSNGWTFLEWLGDLAGTNPSETVWMNRDKTVQAVFGTTLQTTNVGEGTVLVDPITEYYAYGAVVQLVAQPGPGYGFGGWSGATSGTTNPLYFVVTNTNTTVTAYFGQLSLVPTLQAALTVIPIGLGRVNANPSLSVGNWGQSTELTAVPAPGQTFLGWGGAATGITNPITVYFGNQTVVANFTSRPTLSAPPGLAGVSGSGFQVRLTGPYPAVYEMSSSSNLVDWITAGLITNRFGISQFEDVAAPNSGGRYYRGVAP